MKDFRSPRHVVILGSGAMGCLFGGILREGGLNVSLLDIWVEHVEAINRHGLRFVGYGGDRTIPIRATTDGRQLGRKPISFRCIARRRIRKTL